MRRPVPSTQQLVSAVRSGDAAAFGELVRRYERTVTAAAWTVVRDFHTAQDVAQEAFVIGYRKLDQLRDDRGFGPWILSVVRREAIRARDQSAKQARSVDSLSASRDSEDDWRREFEEILPLLAQLPEQERVVVTLKYLDGLTVRQISETTNRPVGTVTKQLSRAVQRLRGLAIEVDR